ncbi:MAG: HAD hydrolase family protein, partial [Burkholderiales bacterium]|nr:HAD hydrolase family protein [Burkholderiales bacterium]
MTNKLINNILEKFIISPGTRKCFIFDLDGTIVFNNQYLVAENENVLKQIIGAGHEVIFATGRPVRDFKTVMPSWCHSLPATLFSGGVSMNQNEIVRNCPVE